MTDVMLFDFDGTITKKDTTKLLLTALLILRPWRIFGLVWFVFNMIRSNHGIIQQEYKNKAIGYLIVGMTEYHMQSALNLFSDKVQELYRPEILKKMKEANQNGISVVIVTASPTFAVSKCVSNLPVTVIGTEFKKKGDFYCRDMNGENCYGVEKVKRIESWEQYKDRDCSFTEAWSDDFSDYPMLKMAKQRYWIGGSELRDIVGRKDPSGNFVFSEY